MRCMDSGAMEHLSVVQLLPALDSGGVERGTLEVAAELVRRGHRSIVLSAGGRLVPELVASGSEHLTWPLGVKSPLTLRWVWRLRHWLQTQRIDILHARSRLPAWIGWLAWRGMDVATRPHWVTTVHGLYSVSRYSAIMASGERVIAVSETVRNYVQHHYPQVAPERIHVIERGVEPSEFPHNYQPDATWLSAWRAQYPQLGALPLLTLPGRLSRLKGHQDFIELLARLRMQGRAVQGLIVGGVEPKRRGYVEQLQRLVRERGLQEHIIFTGQRHDMREIYAISTLVLSLSTQPESFGRTVLEALSLGTPVIGYAHGGVGEVLRRMYPAGLTPVGDVQRLSERVSALLDAPPPVAAQAQFARQRMLDATLALYATLKAAA